MKGNKNSMEVRDYRCCMCPQRNSSNHICPAGKITVYAKLAGWKDSILFKAKRMDTAEWVEGTFTHVFQEDMQSTVCGIHKDVYYIVKENGKLHIVDPDTVCHYTGLDDRNSSKIFEGDIVEIIGEDEAFTVGWDADTAMFHMTSETLSVNFDNYYSYQVEVIGNIHNKENGK